jgi:hypothetical protein
LEASLPRPPADPARRWPVILLALGIFLIPGLLISLKVPSIDIQIGLLVSELTWHQKQSGEIMGPLGLESLGVSSFASINLPRTREADAEQLSEPPSSFQIQEGAEGQISLDTIHAEPGTRLTISRVPGQAGAALYLLGDETSANIILRGDIAISTGGMRLGHRDFGRGRPAQVRAADPISLGLDMRFSGDSVVSFPAHIMISSLSLQKLEEAEIAGARTHRPVSTVLEGEVFNESMGGASFPLRKGEWLTLDGVDGELRSLEMTAEGIRLDFHGTVTELAVGSRNHTRSLMPNRLEWFSERHSVKLLWGAFLWLLTTLLGVIRWWTHSN